MKRRVVAGSNDRGVDGIVKRVQTKVTSLRINSRPNVRTIKDLPSVISEDLKRHGMTNMFGDANKVATFFPGIRREGRIINQVVDRFIPSKLKKRTDVVGGTRENLNRNSTGKGLRGRIVQKEADIHQAEKPEGSGRASAVKDSVSDGLDGLVPTLRRVLLLLVGLTLPIGDAEGT
jgi:hypothetical protein